MDGKVIGGGNERVKKLDRNGEDGEERGRQESEEFGGEGKEDKSNAETGRQINARRKALLT